MSIYTNTPLVKEFAPNKPKEKLQTSHTQVNEIQTEEHFFTGSHWATHFFLLRLKLTT